MQRKSIVLSVLFALIFTFVGLAHPSAVHAACSQVASGTFPGNLPRAFQSPPFHANAGDVITITLSSNPGVPLVGYDIVEQSPNNHALAFAAIPGPSVTASAVAPDNGLYFVQFLQTITNNVTMTYSVTVGCGGGNGVTQLTFTDGRINSHDGQETAAVYCNENDGVDVWGVIDSKGYFAFTATKADLASVPEKPFTNTLIKSGGGVALYRLTTGELQINSANDYVFTWKGCPAA